MNGYLVIVSCMLDDAPVQLCEDREAAVNVAKGVALDPQSCLPPPFDRATECHHVAVMEFVDGRPGEYEIVAEVE